VSCYPWLYSVQSLCHKITLFMTITMIILIMRMITIMIQMMTMVVVHFYLPLIFAAVVIEIISYLFLVFFKINFLFGFMQ